MGQNRETRDHLLLPLLLQVINLGTSHLSSAMNQKMEYSLLRLDPQVVTMDTQPSLAMLAGVFPGTSMVYSYQKFMWSEERLTHLWWREEMTKSLLLATTLSTSLMIQREAMSSNLRQREGGGRCLLVWSKQGLEELCPLPLGGCVNGRRM